MDVVLLSCPTAMCNVRPLAAVVLNMCHVHKDLVPASISAKKYAADVGERIFVALAHIRRLYLSVVRWKQACRGLTDAKIQELKQLLAPLGPFKFSDMDDVDPSELPADVTLSQVSLDSSGFPNLLNDPEPAQDMAPTCHYDDDEDMFGDDDILNQAPFAPPPATKLAMRSQKIKEAAEAQAAVDAACEGAEPTAKGKTKAKAKGKANAMLQSNLGAQSKAKATTKVKVSPNAKAKAKAKAKADAAQTQANHLRATYATAKSHICCKDPATGKKPLWVAITDTQSPEHKKLIRRIMDETPRTKADALSLRDSLL